MRSVQFFLALIFILSIFYDVLEAAENGVEDVFDAKNETSSVANSGENPDTKNPERLHEGFFIRMKMGMGFGYYKNGGQPVCYGCRVPTAAYSNRSHNFIRCVLISCIKIRYELQ